MVLVARNEGRLGGTGAPGEHQGSTMTSSANLRGIDEARGKLKLYSSFMLKTSNADPSFVRMPSSLQFNQKSLSSPATSSTFIQLCLRISSESPKDLYTTTSISCLRPETQARLGRRAKVNLDGQTAVSVRRGSASLTVNGVSASLPTSNRSAFARTWAGYTYHCGLLEVEQHLSRM